MLFLTKFIAIIGAIMAPGLIQGRRAPVECYSTGALLGDYAEEATRFAAESCNHTFGDRLYAKYQIVRDCRSFHANLRLDMRVELFQYPSRNLSVDECYVRMWKLIGCPRGGTWKDRTWFYSLDPNGGGDGGGTC